MMPATIRPMRVGFGSAITNRRYRSESAIRIAIAILIALSLLYLRFVIALPKPTRIGLIVAGIIYIGGAVGMELPLGWWTERFGNDGLGYALIDWLEETLE